MRYRLTRNLPIYGLGGVAVAFIGIKAIHLMVAALHLAQEDETVRL